MTKAAESQEINSTMALECILSAFRKLTAAYVMLGKEPPGLDELDSATQDYLPPENQEQALLYAMATMRQAVHAFTASTYLGGA